MARLFISYSSKDAEATRTLADTLARAGHQVWIDKNIAGGDVWRVRIVDEIVNADAFIIVLSQNSTKSDNVRKELTIAADKEKQIFPVVIDDVRDLLGLQYDLAEAHRIDLRAEAADRQLLNDIQRFCERKEKTSTTPSTIGLFDLGVDKFIKKNWMRSLQDIAKDRWRIALQDIAEAREDLKMLDAERQSVLKDMGQIEKTDIDRKSKKRDIDRKLQEMNLRERQLKNSIYDLTRSTEDEIKRAVEEEDSWWMKKL